MKEITQASMNVLYSMRVQKKNITAITQLLWGNIQAMDELVKFIKENPKATESEILRKATEISKT